jgi:deoxyribodipyrimidine photo-lyase
MSKSPVVMWFRRDLRLADNEALSAAAARGPVLPIFVLDPTFANSGAPRMAFMLRALRALDDEMGGALVMQHGDPVDVLPRVAKADGATEVYVSKDFAPYGRKRDEDVSAALSSVGARLVQSGSAYAVEPGTVRKQDDTPYAVFTPFYEGRLRWFP